MIRPFESSDRAAVLAINAANVPEVGEMDDRKLSLFGRISPWFRVVELDGVVVGFLVGLSEASTEYQSPNYRWFCERYPSFAYVDRIALSEVGRGKGWGPALYDELASWARSTGRPSLCAEVNTVPANPRSIRFHEIYGFAEVARCRPYGPDEEVAMFVATL